MEKFTPRQTEIIEASLELIAEQGIQSLTIKNLSETIGISEPAIYRHFKDKMDILLSILTYFKLQNLQILQEVAVIRERATVKLWKIFSQRFRLFSNKPSLAVVIFSEEIFQNEEKLRDRVRLIMKDLSETVKNIIIEGQKEKEIRSDLEPDQLLLIIMGSIRMIIKKWRMENYSFSLEKEGEKMWTSLLTMIKE